LKQGLSIGRKPWANREPQPITFPTRSVARSSSFHSDVTVSLAVPSSVFHRCSCEVCGAPVEIEYAFCGWCGNHLEVL
jgi:hypothetical protein